MTLFNDSLGATYVYVYLYVTTDNILKTGTELQVENLTQCVFFLVARAQPSCKDYLSAGYSSSGLYNINKAGSSFRVSI